MRQSIERLLGGSARTSVPLVDAALWPVALVAANLARRGFAVGDVPWRGVAVISLTAIAIQLAYGWFSGVYVGRWRFVSFEEAGVIGVGAVLIATILIAVATLSRGLNLVPLSTILAAAAYWLIGAFAFRYVVRTAGELRRVSHHERPHRALVFGAGEAGLQVARVLREDPESEFAAVGFLDDDPGKRRLQVQGLPVLGDRTDLVRVAGEVGADTLVVAIPSATQDTVKDVSRRAQAAGLAVRILPPVSAVLAGEVQASDIRRLELADLLRRGEVRTDLAAIAGYLAGRAVLVTGAGGSIGSALCHELTRHGLGRLLMLDRDESALHSLQLSLDGRGLLDTPDLILADIRDREAMEQIMMAYRPAVVFHAAAHKHVTLLEQHPNEAFKTNVFGTAVALDTSAMAGVEVFVNVSTDKAAAPTSVLGVTKRIAEMLTTGAAQRHGGAFMSVRFGNVLGSRGSVIPTLRHQIELGGPLTITHPDVTRFFMTVEEAVQLVVQAGAIGHSGELLVLDMGDPVMILDVARQLIAQEGGDESIDIEYTGLRPGEKLHEVLVGTDEAATGRPHELIVAYRSRPLDWEDVADVPLDDADKLRERLWEAAGFPVPDQPRDR